MSNRLQKFKDSSAFYGTNASFIEVLYEQFLEDPDSVEETWRQKFKALQNGAPASQEIAYSEAKKQFEKFAKAAITVGRTQIYKEFSEESFKKQSAVARLIHHYRMRGHQQANNNPLRIAPPPPIPELDPAYYGLSEADMDSVFDTDTLYGAEKLTLREIIALLKEIYCGSIGTEYLHIIESDSKRWIRNRLEGSRARLELSLEKKKWLLKLLTAAEGIEKYLHRTYVGQKRFSLEGGESLIPLLDEVIQRAGQNGVREVVIGMAHRGRLNVLINILGKKPAALFEEFEGGHPPLDAEGTSGDVKYHLGFSSDVATPGGPVHLALAFNPSHLEIIDPVVEGSVRARQDRIGKDGENAVIPFLIHGDAAFAGQGVVMETLNMAQTRAFSTGGTIHIVINNQIGFTISNPFDARSTLYCTDVANMVQAPVFHVNADDPEAVLLVAQMALDYRMKFNRDVVIDLICYRRHGHNEADEPAVTQPVMYHYIRNYPTTRKIYADQLIDEGAVTADEINAMEEEYLEALKKGETVSRQVLQNSFNPHRSAWHKYFGTRWDIPCDTSVPLEEIRALSDKLLELPPAFELHPRVAKIMDSRQKMTVGALPIDWGYAENMAYATLLSEGKPVRLTGQDTGRGTFFHRHAILYNAQNGEAYIPLEHIAAHYGVQASIYDSLLSEEGVVGFEYGYSTTEPEALVVWEAQFGDFANVAQVVIDQFISSGEAKWGRFCGLTMLLPHGYEGQGPEHSSARLERFLQLCAEHNMQVCAPTTPAQIFHLLRRQVLRPYRKPLIIMSPKSLLRHRLAVSTLEELSAGKFQPLIGEIDNLDNSNVTRIILCAGKVYYDLLEARRKEEIEHIAILRAEQLYPFPLKRLKREIKRYPHAEELTWCQEEPQNQGAWYQIKHRFFELLGDKIKLAYAGRPLSAAPAAGYFSLHAEQQQAVVASALHGESFSKAIQKIK